MAEDLFGNEIGMDDVIAYPVSNGKYASMNVGIVKEVRPDGLLIQKRIECGDEPIYQNGSAYIHKPQRCIILRSNRFEVTFDMIQQAKI